MSTNWSTAATTAADGRCAVLDALLRGAQPGPVLRERGGRGKHLRRRTGRVRRAIPQPGGDGGGGGGEAGGLAGAVGLVDSGRRCAGVDDGQPAGPDDRRVLDTGDHRDAAAEPCQPDSGGGGVRRT